MLASLQAAAFQHPAFLLHGQKKLIPCTETMCSLDRRERGRKTQREREMGGVEKQGKLKSVERVKEGWEEKREG